MKKQFLVTMFILSAYETCFAQAEYLPTPPSVESRMFLQNVNYPVSNYTGAINVEIPIYTIKQKDFDLPIALTYNTSGIKVEQEASTVGLGWVLNASGIITKTIMGENDLFRPYTYFNKPCSGSPHLSCNEFADIKGLYIPTSNCTLSDYLWGGMWFLSGNYESNYNALTHVAYNEGAGGRDFAPDVFDYNFCGYTGSFIFNRQRQIVKEKEDDVKITPKFDQSGDIESWTATAPNGITFYFEKVERVLYTTSLACNSSWHLTHIETPGGSAFEFSYNTKSHQYWAFSRYQQTDNNGPDLNGFALKSQMYHDCVYLDRISYNGGSLSMSYVFDRQDAKWLPRLASVARHDEHGANTTIWRMEQSYFNAMVLNNDFPTISRISSIFSAPDFDNNWNNKRLKLDRVVVSDPAEGTSHTYALTYNETNLPTKLSAGIDHWGYFNGQPNTTLIGKTYHNVSENKLLEIEGHDGADREAYDGFNQAFILTKIKYPTGGETRFTFESNKYLASVMENDHRKKNFYYGEEKTTIDEPDYYKNVTSNFVNKKTLWIPSAATFENQLMIEYYVEVNCDAFRSQFKPDVSFTLCLLKSGSRVWSYDIKVYDLPQPHLITKENNKFKGIAIIQVPYGDYEMQVYGSLRQMNDRTIFSVTRYSSPEESWEKNPVRNGGGLRIKEIQSITDIGPTSPVAKKTFRYSTVTYGDWSKITGKLMSFPRYNIGYNKYSSNGLRNNGYSVGYSNVFITEVDRLGNTNGTIEYEYINKPDSNLYYRWTVKDSKTSRVTSRSIDENPAGVGPFRFPENGTLLSETYYNDRNDKVKRIEYKYSFLGGLGNMIWGVAKNYDRITDREGNNTYLTQDAITSLRNLLTTNGYDQGIPMGYLYPAMIPTQIFLDKKREIYYNPSPQPATVYTTEYAYHDAFHNFVTKITESDGNKDSLVVENKYAFDFNDAVMSALTAKNRISDPIETRKYKNNQLIMCRQNEYGFFPLYKAAPLLAQSRYKTTEGQAWVPEVTYSNYDKYGNPRVVIIKNVNQIYLWSYRGQYPVLKVENATWEQLRSALGASADELITSLAEKEYPSVTDIERLNALRELLPEAMVTVCEYKPGAGVVSASDPRGVMTNYAYDNFGRLVEVSEKTDNTTPAKNIISAYRYNFAK